MKSHLLIGITFLFLLTCITGCKTTPVDSQPDSATMTVARSFLNNIEAGEIALMGFDSAMAEQGKSSPGLAEIMNRVFADMDSTIFVEMAATIYAKNLSYDTLAEVERHSQKESIQRFFKIIFNKVISGEKIDNKLLLSQFNADELLDIMKLGANESFIEMKAKLPIINNEMAVQSKMLGEKMMMDYIENN